MAQANQPFPDSDFVDGVEAAICGWRDRIAQFEALLDATDEMITLHLGDDQDVTYIQARRGDDGLLVEAVSNRFLPEHTRLSVDDECTMLELGWTAPSPTMPNFFRFYRERVDSAEVAGDIALTFGMAYHATPCSTFAVSPSYLIDALQR